LSGIRILDLSVSLTGPYAVALLADQGAHVIKVERPGAGDLARWLGVRVNRVAALHVVVNRGKRSIVVDLDRGEGVEIVRRLAAKTDVVVQNFRPGVIEQMGIGYDEIRGTNPDVIYVSISGFGDEGPYRDRSAYDTVIQAYSGIAANQADPDDEVPVFLRQTMADKVTALTACQAITAALLARERGAGGQHVKLSMMDAVVSFLWADAAGNETMVASDHSAHSSFVAGFQPIRFVDGWGIVCPATPKDFGGQCRAFGVDGWDEPGISTMEGRQQHRELIDSLDDLCRASAATLAISEAADRLRSERVPFSMVLTPAELVEDEHARAVGLFEELKHPEAGPIRLPRHPVRFGRTPAVLANAAPALGQHTDEILSEIGLADRIAGLRETGVVA
jgi:crotonobetainyl-CoA:carnitine CoA-transferase CaiB-like acyl-CoA transferase